MATIMYNGWAVTTAQCAYCSREIAQGEHVVVMLASAGMSGMVSDKPDETRCYHDDCARMSIAMRDMVRESTPPLGHMDEKK